MAYKSIPHLFQAQILHLLLQCQFLLGARYSFGAVKNQSYHGEVVSSTFYKKYFKTYYSSHNNNNNLK